MSSTNHRGRGPRQNGGPSPSHKLPFDKGFLNELLAFLWPTGHDQLTPARKLSQVLPSTSRIPTTGGPQRLGLIHCPGT